MVAQIGEGPMRKASGRHEEYMDQRDRSPLRRKRHRHAWFDGLSVKPPRHPFASVEGHHGNGAVLYQVGHVLCLAA